MLREPSALGRALRTLPLALLLGGCVTNAPNLPGLPFNLPGTAGTPTKGAPAPAAVPAVAILATRDPQALQRLFAGSTVTGADLIPELMSFKRLGRGPGTPSMGAFMGTAAAPVAGTATSGGLLDSLFGGGSAILNAGLKLGMQSLESVLAETVMGVAFAELQGHLDFLIGDTHALAAESVTLPSPQGLTAEQMQRAVTMAAIVVATRITGKMLKKAQQDLTDLDGEYQTLITRREEAAALLQQALAGGLPASAGFSDADLAYLRNLAATEGVAGFVKDLGAQTLALRLVAVNDPTAFAAYRVQSEGLTRRQTAIVRTVAGALAYGGLLVGFGTEFAKLGKSGSFAEVVAIGPLALAFVTETPSILQSTYGIVTEGVGSLVRGSRSFRVSVGARTDEVSSADDVFRILARNGAATEWQAALFRDGGRGLLQSVHQCDARSAAQMLDLAVPQPLRDQIARDLGMAGQGGFTFTDAVSAGNLQASDELLSRDHRPRLADGRRAMAQAQLAVAGQGPANDGAAAPGYLHWNDEQLMKLVFSNRDGNAARFAAMEIAGVTVKPVPSMQSLYAYESLADNCRTQSLPPVATATGAPASPAKASKPARPVKPSKPTKPAKASAAKPAG